MGRNSMQSESKSEIGIEAGRLTVLAIATSSVV